MPGSTDLPGMLADLRVERRPGTVTFVSVPTLTDELAAVAHAVVVEAEGITAVVDVEAARAASLDVEFEGAWLTLTVHSSLEAVGLTAHVSAVLARAGIACNVVAGFHHDHLVVPVERADEAIALLSAG